MKTIHSITKTTFFLLATTVLVMLSSCSKKMMFSSSNVVPAAVGSVKVKTDKNKNHSIQVKVTHLAPASKLSPPKSTYVVWMVTENNGTKNIGQLKSSGSLLSKALKGSLSTVTSFDPRNFFITAEDDGDTQYPGPTTVLTTN